MEAALAAWGNIKAFVTKTVAQFRANGSQVARLRTKSYLAELSAVSAHWRRQRPMGAKWRKSRSSQPHFTRAGGQDDVSSEQTPSN